MVGLASQLLPKAGEVIDGKYTLEGLLGKGGMGAVFAARHNKLGHRVAIKVMLADAGDEAAKRFVNEGSAAANIQNDHVVRVFDVDVDEKSGLPYMVLELLEGEDLAEVLDRDGPLPPHVATDYVLQALEGVKQAHALGIVHRDLKPSNLFLTRRPNGSIVVKVLDFGISKAGGASPLGQSPEALTATKSMLGSPLYMSPEQLRSAKNVDARADIWAMGIILFELLSGTLPFRGENFGELFAAILETDAPSIRGRVATVPPGLDAVVAKCLQRRREDRYQSIPELERALAPFTNAALAGASFQTHALAPMSAPLSGPSLPSAKAKVPSGAVTPQPHRQTGNAWQSSGSQARASNKWMMAVLAVAGVLALIGLGLVAVVWMSRGRADRGNAAHATASPAITSAAEPSASASASSSPTSPAATVAALPSGGASAPVASASPNASAAIATGPKRPLPPAVTVKVEPTKTASGPSHSPPPPTATGLGPLQGNR